MRLHECAFVTRVGLVALVGLALAQSSAAQVRADGGAPPKKAPPAAEVAPTTGVIEAGPLEIDPDTGEPLHAPPPGRPGGPPSGNAGHGGQRGGGGPPGMFEAPPDTVEDDEHLPPGTIAITILDPDNRPIPRAGIVLAILHNTVAKGENATKENRAADDNGNARFDKLESTVGVSYRVTVPIDGALFGSFPFQLAQGKGKRVVVHVYPVTRDINAALIVLQTILYMEMKDDRVQLQEAVGVFNFGRVAWVPEDTVLGLPNEFTAFTTGEMTDTGVVAETAPGKKGARLRGTFGPGRHDVEFRWQLPYSGAKDVEFELGLPPHVAVARVIAAASAQMRLDVGGFEAAQGKNDEQGQHLLITEKQLKRDDPPLKSIKIALRNLPTIGWARVIASGFAVVGVFAGIGIALTLKRPTKKKGATDSRAKLERGDILKELEELEKAHLAGDVGPKTYERARRDLIDALARTLTAAPPAASSAAKT